MATKKELLVQLAVRIPATLVKRIDKIAEDMSEDGIRITRGEAFRKAAFRGVDLLEEESRKKK